MTYDAFNFRIYRNMEKNESAVDKKMEYLEVTRAAYNLVSNLKDQSLLTKKMWVLGHKPNSRDKYIVIATSDNFQESDKRDYRFKFYGIAPAENANEVIIQELWEKSNLPIVIDDEIAEKIFKFRRDPREEDCLLIVKGGNSEKKIPLLTPSKKIVLH